MSANEHKITIRVPASTSNLGSGFDVLGLGLGFYLTVEVERREGPVRVECSGEGADDLPGDASNLIAQMALAGDDNIADGFLLRAHNEIPLTRGFGSSASAIVAGLAAGQWLRTGAIDREEILRRSTSIEGHPDNVSASIYGGLTVSAMIGDQVRTSSHRLPEGLRVVGVVPDRELSTRAAREALPDAYSREDVVFNLQRLGLLLSALKTGDLEAFADGLEDRVHQSYRIGLLPEMRTVIDEMAASPHCVGAFVSGAGPAVAAFVTESADKIGARGVAAFTDAGISASYRVLDVDHQGIVLS